MEPEEKHAARLIKRHKIVPPYNLEELVSLYAEIEFLPFPKDINADGISYGLKKLDKPKIYINSSRPKVRQNFTLAHELGHVIIPWHTGNIVSHTDIKVIGEESITESGNYDDVDYEYRLIENEANRFAAEILIPSLWLSDMISDLEVSRIDDFLEEIIDKTRASKDATLIKLFNVLPAGYSCVQIDSDGTITNSFISKDTQVRKPIIGTEYYSEVYPIYKEKIDFSLGNRHYILWTFDQFVSVPDETDVRTWREILKSILNDLDMQSKMPSINAILPSAFQTNKDKADSEIISIIYHRYSNHKDLKRFIEHPLFDQYVIKRFKELRAKQK